MPNALYQVFCTVDPANLKDLEYGLMTKHAEEVILQNK